MEELADHQPVEAAVEAAERDKLEQMVVQVKVEMDISPR
jgi:hypothetical protein